MKSRDIQDHLPIAPRQIVTTHGALELAKQSYGPAYLIAVLMLFRRHLNGDWGHVDNFDSRSNDDALISGYRILAAYTLCPIGCGRAVNGACEPHKVWIITEADRSATTMLLPSEY
ncbi:hypothetical protein [Catenuloplanes japonicus]|uniref:hypothetical protein n=1 Tax=Catenuloplanes japonicus TaxID=33876 RepID=UPI000690293F|nr:hypothetical protein [Catenuloplanes japonicus]